MVPSLTTLSTKKLLLPELGVEGEREMGWFVKRTGKKETNEKLSARK